MHLLLLAAALHWWVVAPHEVKTTSHTHVQVTGWVSEVHKEADGDIHVQICDKQGCVVAEIIPALPHPMPVLGTTVTVRGISRIDPLHKWAEIHPVIEIH